MIQGLEHHPTPFFSFWSCNKVHKFLSPNYPLASPRPLCVWSPCDLRRRGDHSQVLEGTILEPVVFNPQLNKLL